MIGACNGGRACHAFLRRVGAGIDRQKDAGLRSDLGWVDLAASCRRDERRFAGLELDKLDLESASSRVERVVVLLSKIGELELGVDILDGLVRRLLGLT